MKNILFYKYVPIENIEQFRDEHYALCEKHHLLGKVLVAEEGINGCLSGKEEDVDAYKAAMKKDERFSDMMFKEGPAEEHTFRKLFVKIREEIITSRFNVDAKDAAPYVEPEQLKEWIENDDVVLVDARNTYETKEGMFENALDPKIKTFQEWPEAVKKMENLKGKKIVTYCTGGIRCEKASAYMKQQGFEVYQLHGGILEYGKKTKGKHWNGKCFVFDRRGSVELDPEEQSGEIAEEIKQKVNPKEKIRKEKKLLGKVTNYFGKIGVVEIPAHIEEGQKIVFVGDATGIKEIEAKNVRYEGPYTTFVCEKVRKKDEVFV